MNPSFMFRLFLMLAPCLVCCSCTSLQSNAFQNYDANSFQSVETTQPNRAREYSEKTQPDKRNFATSRLAPSGSAQALRTNASAENKSEQVAAQRIKGTPTEKPRLTPGDMLELKVYQEEELNSRVRIDNDGILTLPLVGPISVGGKTLEEARSLIRDILARDYLFNPHVSLTVAEYAKRRFSVMGEVKLPGFYSIPENESLNLLQALSMAGGYTVFSKGNNIRVKRVMNGKETILRVDAAAMAKHKNVKMLEIQAEDAIEVGQSLF
ncbi:MAG: sugar transporter [Pedosphaera sp.]|nr:sugar transporter [Pedosphaera sp.]